MHCDLKTVENYAREYPQLAEIKRQEHESVLDTDELALLRAVQNGKRGLSASWLKTQGKGRGYIERAEMSGPNGAVEVEVTCIEG